MPFCARCLGCSIGHILSLGIFLLGYRSWYLLALTGMIILLVDWLLQNYFKLFFSNISRLITGILGGFGVGCFIWNFIAYIFKILILKL